MLMPLLAVPLALVLLFVVGTTFGGAPPTTATGLDRPAEAQAPSLPEQPVGPSFSNWAKTDGQRYVQLSDKLHRILDARVTARPQAVEACREFGRLGLVGLGLPESPSAAFNRSWWAAMSEFVDAGTYGTESGGPTEVDQCVAAIKAGSKSLNQAARYFNKRLVSDSL